MPSRPNFLIFVTDQMRADHMGCAGNPVIRTPHLDALAAEGVRCSRAYVNNPLCMPSRATLFTGLTPRAHEVRTNGIPLDPRFPTMPAALARAGYRTHSVGKIHLTPYGTPKGVDPASLTPSAWPEASAMWGRGLVREVPVPYFGLQGVEVTLGHGPGTGGDYRRWLRAQDPKAEALLAPEAGRPSRTGAENCWHSAIPEELHYNTWVAARAIAFLESHPMGEPFFLWCSFPDPHHPYCPPEPWASRYHPADIPLPTRREGELADLPPHYRLMYETGHPTAGRFGPTHMGDDQIREILALTYGMISHVDDCIGRVMAALERSGRRQDTVVCFLSDHGDMMGDHWIINKGPFHFQGLLGVPFIWSAPGRFPAGRTCAGLASFLDFAPTVLDLAGVPIPEGPTPPEPESPGHLPPWPGRSLAPMLTGAAEGVQDSVVVENDEDYLGLRLRTLITDRWWLTAYPGQEYGELFDLEADPGQLHNLWHAPPAREIKRDLLIQLMERLVETDSTLPRRLCHA